MCSAGPCPVGLAGLVGMPCAGPCVAQPSKERCLIQSFLSKFLSKNNRSGFADVKEHSQLHGTLLCAAGEGQASWSSSGTELHRA